MLQDARADTEVVDALLGSSSFAGLGRERLLGIIRESEIEQHPANTLLFSEGDIGRFAYLVLAGSLSVDARTPKGIVTVAVIRRGGLVGEVGALTTSARTASVSTIEPATLLRIEQSTIRKALADSPEAAMAVIAELGARIQSLNGVFATLTQAASAVARDEFDPLMLDELRKQAQRYNHFADIFEDMAVEMHRRRLHSHEMRTAAEIQASFLPRRASHAPTDARYAISARMKPAREIGGDFYDWFQIDDRRLALLIGDVSGKGVPAAMFMGVSRMVLRTAARQGGSAAEILARANDLLAEDNTEAMFVTVALVIVDLATGHLHHASAGHEEVYFLTGGRIERAATTGPAIALFPGARFRVVERSLAPGDGLVLATDGVTEAFTIDRDMFGETRTHETLGRNREATPEVIVGELIEAVERFAGSAPQSDDITCLAFRYLGEDGPVSAGDTSG